MIDGLRVADHLVVGALGIDADGHKRVLGLVEGATENHTVVMALLQDLITRGLTAAQGLLVVIDGAKALAKAVHDVWGDQVLIQRCQIHKQRNVLDHLPKSAENRIRQRLRKAYQEPDADTAAQALEALAKELERDHPGAAGSLREGLAETLTVLRLGLPGLLRQTLANTNALESINSQLRTHAQNVKHWTNGQQVLRWMASASLFYRRHVDADPRLSRDSRVANGLKSHVFQNAGTKNRANRINHEKGCASEIPRSLGQPRLALRIVHGRSPIVQTPMHAAFIVKTDPLGSHRIRLCQSLKDLIPPTFSFEQTVPGFDVGILVRSRHRNAFVSYP